MRLGFFIFVIAMTTSVFGQSTVFEPSPDSKLRDGWRLLDGRWIRPGGEFRWPQIISTGIDGHRLTISVKPDDTWTAKLISGRRIIAERLPERDLWWMMLTRSSQLVAYQRRGTTIVIFPTTEPAEDDSAALRIVGVTLTPSNTLIRGAGVVDGKFVRVEYSAKQDGTTVRLTVVGLDRRGYDFAEADLFSLLNKSPQVTRQYLGPLLAELADEDVLRPRAADVYRAFNDIEPTREELAQVSAVIPDLNSENLETRDAASKKLAEMGPPAVLVALHLDLSKLAPEQVNRLSELIDSNTLGPIDGAAARADLAFLKAASSFPDRRVRDAARDLLAKYQD